MKRPAGLIFAAVLACPGLVPGTTAQEAQEDVERDAPVTAGEPAQDVIPFSDEPSLLYATELMQRAEIYAQAIEDVSEVPEVEAIEVSALPRVDASLATFEDTMDRFMTYYRDDLAALRDAMAGNPVVQDALEQAGIELSSILAAEIRPDLALRVYIRDW